MKSPSTLEPHTTAPPEEPPAHAVPPGTVKYPELEPARNKRGIRHWLIWWVIFALIGYGCYRLYLFSTGNKQEMASKRSAIRNQTITVGVAGAKTGNLPVYLSGLGTVTAFNTVSVKPRIDGQLVNVAFREGQYVHKGDLLAQIDPRPYQVALQSAESSLAQAKGNLARDQAILKDAQANVERNQELFKAKIVAKQQLDTQVAAAGQAQGSIAADQAAIQTAEAEISSAKLNLTYSNVTAPISGRIGLRMVDVGNIVRATDPTGIAVITQLQPITVLFGIPEEQLPPVLDKLRAGTKLKTAAFDRNGNHKIAEGTLLTVDNQIDATTGTSRLKAVFPNEDNRLFPNQFVNVRLALDTKRDQTIVPTVAVQRGPDGTFVYVVNDNSTVSVRPVKLGISEGNNVAIDEGLKAGDRVVVDGAEKLTDGMKVTIHQNSGRENSQRSS